MKPRRNPCQAGRLRGDDKWDPYHDFLPRRHRSLEAPRNTDASGPWIPLVECFSGCLGSMMRGTYPWGAAGGGDCNHLWWMREGWPRRDCVSPTVFIQFGGMCKVYRVKNVDQAAASKHCWTPDDLHLKSPHHRCFVHMSAAR